MIVAYALSVIEDTILSTFREVEISSKSEMLKESMLEEMNSLQKNDTCELSELPKGKRLLVASRYMLRRKDLKLELLFTTRLGW